MRVIRSCVNSATGVLIPCQCPMSRDSFIAVSASALSYIHKAITYASSS